jgi:hypothetical protein
MAATVSEVSSIVAFSLMVGAIFSLIGLMMWGGL